MHIALCHDAVIPPPKYGGTERVVAWLAKGLLEAGHRVTLIAKTGSYLPGTTFLPYPAPHTPFQTCLPSGVDLVHFFAPPPPISGIPFLVNIGGNGKPGERFHRNTVFVSKKHAELHGSHCFVHNGLDPTLYCADSDREDYLVFLAKASWSVKNVSGAIRVARLAGVPLHVLGSRNWPFQLQRLLPPIRGVTYHGMVDDRTKAKILRKARGLLFPVTWHEPFGIALTEALASGCPVFGTPYGSLPEIITPEVGVLSSSAEELAAAVLKKRFNPSVCREHVLKHFTYEHMTKKYLDYYHLVLHQGFIQESEPQFTGVPLTGLPWNNGTTKI